MDSAFRIEDFLIQPDLNQISTEESTHQVEPKVMGVLVYLAQHAGEAVIKERLIQAVWADTFVTDEVLTTAIWKLRDIFGDDAKNPHVIQTIPKKGYRLIADVSSVEKASSRYRILEKLGQGAMGEVFLAEDKELRRKVALKFLPEEKEQDETSRKRLLREARAAAALDHPFICRVYDTGEIDGRTFIAMEYLEGETLKEKLAQERLVLREALQVASEIAEALEEAHQRGFVHRDLKPSNIMLTDRGHVKVMDFGLAKRVISTGEVGGQETSLTDLTEVGTTVGTPAYMSPEQVRNEEVEARSDIFSMGIIVYEMLAGVHPFRKSEPIETANAILNEEPAPLTRYREDVSEVLVHVVHKMLAKDPDRRSQSVHEIHTDLSQLLQDMSRTTQAGTVPQATGQPLPWRQWLPWVLLPLVAVAVWTLRPKVTQSPIPNISFEIPLPEGERLASWHRHGLALSPDGSLLAFVSGTISGRFQPERTQIYFRRLDQWQAQPIPGTENGCEPFFSPDGRWLGFASVGPRRPVRHVKLKKVAVTGGEPFTICECNPIYGASWGEDGTIVFSAAEDEGLKRVSASGGEPELITKLDRETGEESHRLPHILPGSRGVLFTVLRSRILWDGKRAQVFVKPLPTGQRKLLVQGGTDARYVPTGHLVFAREGRLFAVPFDLKRLEVTGPEVPILEGINHSVFTGSSGWETTAAQFSFSGTGMLAYVAGSVFPEIKHTVVWVDRQGREEPLEVDPKTYARVRVSPDARQVLLTTLYPPMDVWLFDVERKIMRRQTFEGNPGLAIWGPGAGEFTLGKDGTFYTKRVDSELKEMLFTETELRGTPSSWSRDGQMLALVTPAPGTDIWVLMADGKAEPFLRERFAERWPEFSPDGRWIAYASDESGRYEVYVRPYPGPGSAVQISTAGGRSPAWSPDGREIFYRQVPQARKFFAVRIDLEGSRLQPQDPVPLFERRYIGTTPVRSYDVAPDGRFLLIKSADKLALAAAVEQFFPTRIRFIQNWFEELKRLVPTDTKKPP